MPAGCYFLERTDNTLLVDYRRFWRATALFRRVISRFCRFGWAAALFRSVVSRLCRFRRATAFFRGIVSRLCRFRRAASTRFGRLYRSAGRFWRTTAFFGSLSSRLCRFCRAAAPRFGNDFGIDSLLCASSFALTNDLAGSFFVAQGAPDVFLANRHVGQHCANRLLDRIAESAANCDHRMFTNTTSTERAIDLGSFDCNAVNFF